MVQKRGKRKRKRRRKDLVKFLSTALNKKVQMKENIQFDYIDLLLNPVQIPSNQGYGGGGISFLMEI